MALPMRSIAHKVCISTNTLAHVYGLRTQHEPIAVQQQVSGPMFYSSSMITDRQINMSYSFFQFNCLKNKTEDDDPFQCPLEETKRVDSKGQTVVHPKYPHESDCQSFYVCLNGREKRLLGCEAGKVYNIEDEICDDPENVEGW